MAVIWSRLHEVLGIDVPRSLTAEDIARVIELNVNEDAALEFKADRRSDEHGKDELGKDVAAMANSGGGTIVFGIGERDEGTTKHLVSTPIQLTEQAAQQIRAIVSARVRPLITGIEVEQVSEGDGAGYGYLLVLVPASPDAPHFYERGNQAPAAPWRNGSHIEVMREREIERAYRDRFARHDDATTALARTLEATTRRLDFTNRSTARWLVAAARPTGSLPLASPNPRSFEVRALLDRAHSREPQLFQVHVQTLGILTNLTPDPRYGLKRWVIRHRSQDQAATTTPEPYAELHHDGTTVLAFPVVAQGRPEHDERVAVAANWVEAACAAAVVLTSEWLDERRIAGSATVVATIVSGPADRRPTWIEGMSSPSGLYGRSIPPGTGPVDGFEASDAVLAAPRTVDARRAAAVELAEGVLHQFGYGLLEMIGRPDASSRNTEP